MKRLFEYYYKNNDDCIVMNVFTHEIKNINDLSGYDIVSGSKVQIIQLPNVIVDLCEICGASIVKVLSENMDKLTIEVKNATSRQIFYSIVNLKRDIVLKIRFSFDSNKYFDVFV